MIRRLTLPTLLLALTSLLACGDRRLAKSIGEGCSSDGDCPGELFCSPGSPTDVCAAHCDSDEECHDRFGSEFDCVAGDTRCARRCNSDSDCPDSDCVPFTSGNDYCSN